MSFSPPGRGPLVALLLAHIAFGLFAMTLPLPSMQAWGSEFTAPQSAVQLSFSAYVVMFGSMQLLYGPWSDRLGRRRVLLAGLALAFAGSVGAALAGGMESLIAWRALQGAGAAAGAVVGRALVQDLFKGPERTRVMAWVGMTLGLCPPAATLVGGQLHVHVSWRASFALAAVAAVALALATLRALPAAPPPPAQAGRWWVAMAAAYGQLLREPAYRLYIAVFGFTSAAFYAFLGGAPLVLGNLGVGPQGVGLYIMVVPLSYIGGNYAASRLAARLGGARLMVIGQALTLLGLALMLLLSRWPHPLTFALPLVLLGIGHGLLMPPVLAGIVGVLPALAGAASAGGGLAQQLVGALGAWSVGLVDHDSSANLGVLMLGFTAAAALLQVRLLRRLNRP